MSLQRQSWDLGVAVALACAVVGLVALPLAFSSGPSWTTPVWLLVGIVISVYLLVLAPRLSRSLAKLIDDHVVSDATPSQTLMLARLFVLAVLLVVAQAILRRPIALLLGGGAIGAAPLEAGIAALVLAAVLALLVWLYQTGRPMVQSATRHLIDAAIPTVAPATPAAVMLTATVDPQATVAAPLDGQRSQSRRDADPTQRTNPAESDLTRRTNPVESDVTRRTRPVESDLTQRTNPVDADSTVRTSRVEPNADATLRAEDPPA
jgi:hypothetical protein